MRWLWRTAALLLALASGLSGADTFERSNTSIRVGPKVSAIAAADLNGDGLPELITADTGRLSDLNEERPANDQLSFFVATGPLEYEAQPQLRTGFGPYAIAVANVDALEAPDLIVVNFHASRNRDLTLLRNLGGGLFEPLNFTVSDDETHYSRMRDGDGQAVFSKPGLTALRVFDFDGDGYRDALATGWSSDVLVYFRGHIDDYFSAPILIDLEGGPRDLGLADFDQDGEMDVAVALYSAGEIAILRGLGDGKFELASRFPSRAALPGVLKTADMDGDGAADLIVGHVHAEDSVAIFAGGAGLSFPVSQEIVLGEVRGAIEFEIRDVLAEDFNRDGRIDLAVAGHKARQVVVLIQQPSEGFPLKFKRETYRFKKGRPRKLVASDFNGDGKLDIAVALWETDRIEFLLGRD